MKKIIFILFIGFLCSMPKAHAQTTFKGKVVDSNNNPVYGVNITSVKTNQGVMTSDNGSFSIELKNPVINASSIGYESKTITLSNSFNKIVLNNESQNLDEIVITSANKIEQKRLEVPAAVGIMTTKQIEETKATQIDQLVNQMTGVHMSNLGNESHTMSIRSPLSYKALFLFSQDGVAIRPTGDFSHTALKGMDQASIGRVEVIRGANSATYGSEAIGGVINFITQNPTKNFSGKVSLQANDIGYKRAEFNASTTVGKTGVFVGGHIASIRDGWRDHSDFDKSAYTAKITHQASDQLDFTLTSNYINSDSDSTGNLTQEQYDNNDVTSVQTFTYSKSITARNTLFTNYKWNDNNTSKLTLFHRYYESDANPHYRISTSRTTGDVTGEISSGGFKSYGSIFQHSLKSDILNSNLVFGGSLDYSPATSNRRAIDITQDDDGKYISYTDFNDIFEDYEVDYYNHAAFVQLHLSPIKNLKISGALRYDSFKYIYSSTEELTFLAGITDDNVSFDNITPKIGATYDFGNSIGVYTNYSLGFIPPQIDDVYGADIINRAIDPQRFNNYEVGGWLSFDNKKGYLDFAIYQLNGENEVITVVLEDGTEENQNVGKTSHKGVELGLKYRILNDLKFRFNGTYAHHKYEEYNNGKDDYSGNYMERAPKWIINTALNYQPSYAKGLRVELQLQHLGKYFQSAANDDEVTYPGYNLLHLRTGYKFQKIKGLELWLNVLNLADLKYAEMASVSDYSGAARYRPGNPRNFNFGIQYNW